MASGLLLAQNCNEDVISPAQIADYEEVIFTCEDNILPTPDLMFLDNCSDVDMYYQSFRMDTIELNEYCFLTEIPLDFPHWTGNLWLNYNGDLVEFVYESMGELMITPSGALLTGTVARVDDPSWRLYLHIELSAPQSWDDWSSQLTTIAPFLNRTYKSSGDIFPEDIYETWTYMELLPSSYAVGLGALDGDMLSFSNQPANMFYGFQKGLSAGNTGEPYPLEAYSAWMMATGTILGEPVTMAADIAGAAHCSPIAPQAIPPTEHRIWAGIDAEENSRIAEQLVYELDDNQEAGMVSFYGAPSDMQLTCVDQVPNADQIVAVRDCEAVAYELEETTTGDACEGYVISRSYTASNTDGSIASHSYVITVEGDILPPVIYSSIDSWAGACAPSPEALGIEIKEYCGESYVLTFTDTEDVACGELNTRVYVATDACGNSSSLELSITMFDSSIPEIISVPADLTLSCNTPLPAELVEATDLCSLEFSYSDELSGDACVTLVTRTHSATDDCGNMAQAVQTIELVDDVSPYFTDFPADEVHSCQYEVGEAPQLEATDNCDVEPLVTVEVVQTGLDCERIIERIYTAVDACGNSASQIQVITFDQSIVGLDELDANAFIVTSHPEGLISLSYDSQVNAQSYQVDVYDQQGRAVYSAALTNEIDLGALSPGIYELLIRGEREEFQHRIQLGY